MLAHGLYHGSPLISRAVMSILLLTSMKKITLGKFKSNIDDENLLGHIYLTGIIIWIQLQNFSYHFGTHISIESHGLSFDNYKLNSSILSHCV